MNHSSNNYGNIYARISGLHHRNFNYVIRKAQQKLFMAIILGLLICTSCSNNDDDTSGNQQTNLQLLTSGKWYNESKTPGSYTACEKKGYVQFETNGNLTVNSFDDGSGTCQSLGYMVATYTLTGDVNITITFGSDVINAVIDTISENQLIVVTVTETTVFDKTEG